MAFFSAVSSSIGKKLLLFGLRQIDILDKDPSDFVSVDVGKKTTLEVRDVGLHVKKLVALLHLQLPPEIHIASARASLLRVTFVLDFGVPQIIIEIDGIQLRARIAEDVALKNNKSTHNQASTNQPQRQHRGPRRRTSSPLPTTDDASDPSEVDDEHIPTVDDLAQSFIREEPPEEIRELEEALHTQSEYLQDSVSDYGDDELSAGVGAPLGLPTMLRNVLNTALDRLQITADHIDIQVEDHMPPETPTSTAEDDASPVTLNFHVDRIYIDSVTSEEPRVDVTAATPIKTSGSKLGKRRMRIENIYTRLISRPDTFSGSSRVSGPLSPSSTRSEASTDVKFQLSTKQETQSEASSSQVFMSEQSVRPADVKPSSPKLSSVSTPTLRDEVLTSRTDLTQAASRHEQELLEESVHTVDEDRFADAASEDGLEGSVMSDSLSRSRQSFVPPGVSASSMLYDDEGALEYAIENSMLSSQGGPTISELLALGASTDSVAASNARRSHDTISADSAERQSSPTETHSNTVPADSFHGTPPMPASSQFSHVTSTSGSQEAHGPENSDDDQIIAELSVSGEQDLTESRLFTHDDAESMYMSAMSAAPTSSSRGPAIPGSWDSASSSSHDTASDSSGPIPASMLAGSILNPLPEADDGCETPRPGSRQSALPSLREQFSDDGYRKERESDCRLAKLFLTVDTVTIWFPLGLSEDDPYEEPAGLASEPVEFSFNRPDLGADSIFQDMPGSFSNYAHSTSSRKRNPTEISGLASRRTEAKISEPTIQSTRKDIPTTVNVDVGSVVGHIDFSTGRILVKLIQRILNAIPDAVDATKQTPKTENLQSSSAQNSSGKTNTNLTLSVKHVGIAWLERLATESLSGSNAYQTRLDTDPTDAILRISLNAVQAASESQVGRTISRLVIGKFVLASLDQDIIGFQKARPRSKRSAASVIEQSNNDIEIVYEQAKEKRITVATRPVIILFDMQKVDEALGSFGGFSGVLEMGNSISSANAVHSPVISSLPPKARGVRFGDSPPPLPLPPTNPSGTPKIDVRFEDVSFVLRGQTCELRIQTTPVKAAIRASNVRLKVAEVRLSGPHVNSDIGTPMFIDVKDTTINFRFTPDEADLTRLISMINPSKDPYENDGDILIETLLRQRRKGSVVRAEITSIGLRVPALDQLKTLEALGAELARLSKVTKYLPDDDRPGILALATVRDLEASVMVNEKLGEVFLSLREASVAHVGVPSLLAVEVGKASVEREGEVLLHEVVDLGTQDQLPMIMARIIGDEIEPVVKVKLFNVCAEYRVSTVMAALGISENGTTDDIALGLASSVATITGASSPQSLSRQQSDASSPPTASSKPFHIDLLLRSCALGLNPRAIPSKALFVLTNAHVLGRQAKKADYSITVELREASIHAIDDISRIEDQEASSAPSTISLKANRQLHELKEQGFVSLSSISAAKVLVSITGDGKDLPQIVDVEFKNKLFVLEACADSTQTLVAILNGLQPPAPPSTAQRYRTVVPLQEMMESFTGDAFAAPNEIEDDDFMETADLVADEVPTNLEYVGSFYNQESLPTEEDLGDSMLSEDDLEALATPPTVRQRGDQPLLASFQEQYEVAEGENEFDFDENYFHDSDSDHKGNARKWDSAKNQYHLTNEFKTPDAPLKVRVRDMNIILNLFDGYDWPKTRAIFTQAVEDLEARAEERRQRPREEDDDEFQVEQDFLFNSVWIGVPVQDERGALARRINHDIDDLASETGSYATSTATRSTGATARPHSSHKSSQRRKLKLERSKHKKIAFELSGVAVDLIVFPPDSGETQNSLDVRIHNFEIFDHVPTSTWKKFVTGLIDPSLREMGKPMIRLELQTVRPVTDLAASELVIKVTVSPLRLHVDQDALDFITRFFEFKDETVSDSSAPADQPFIQRLEVMSVTLKLDYKPKRVDYRGLRSGHTTEFMNFLILDGSDIILRHAIVYGITNFDKLNKTLNDVWMPDVKQNQLPGVLSGLAAVRPIVNVGSGVRDLVVVPMREYKKDGRIVRSLQKGVYAFAKNTTSEAARLGARVAIGAQNLLEGAENFLNPQASSPRAQSSLHDWDDLDPSDTGEDEPRAISNYANQPIGVKAGLRSAARYLERDLLTARDAVIAIPTEVMEEGTGIGMAKAIARRAPTVILRPALGATKAIGNTLLGVGNALDKDSKRKIEDKYKSY